MNTTYGFALTGAGTEANAGYVVISAPTAPHGYKRRE